MENIPNWAIALIVVGSGWFSWVTLQVAQIRNLVTKLELLESEQRTKDDIIAAFKEVMRNKVD